MSTETNKAANVSPPRAGDVYSRVTAATSTRYEVPAAWRGNWVRIHVKGEAVQVLFGGSGVSVTMNEVSSLSSEALTPSVATGEEIPADSYKDFRVSDTDTHFAVVAAGTSGQWQARLGNNLTR
jgi:hypothetical protein